MEDKPILSINIPTYNRASYLKRCLFSICNQLTIDSPIFIKVYDNDSADDTHDIVKSFMDKHNQISYYKNEKNIGPDLNIGQCYYLSNTKYTWVFGDDDILLDGGLIYILTLLKQDIEYGLIFLNYYIFSDNFKSRNHNVFCWERHTYQTDSTSLMRIAGHKLGFISACIVNSKAIDKNQILINAGTNFNHLYPILNSLNLQNINLYIGKYYLAQQSGNSDNLDFFKVFADNLYTIFIECFGKKHKIVKLLKLELLICILPSAIVAARKNKTDKTFNTNSFDIVFNNFSTEKLFWIINYPLLKMPIPIIIFLKSLYLIISKIYNDTNRYIFYIFNYYPKFIVQKNNHHIN